MTPTELLILKSSGDRLLRLTTIDGEELIVKVISVFDKDSDPDLFYKLISPNRPALYVHRETAGDYSIPLDKIASVSALDT